VTIASGIYDGVGLAAAIQTAMGNAYTCTYNTSGGLLGQITITHVQASLISYFIVVSRQTLLREGTFAGQPIVPSALEDASDVLGTTHSDVQGQQTGVLNLGHGLGYRQVELNGGKYSFDSLAVELARALNDGTTLGANTYSVGKNTATSRLSIVNTSSPLLFYIYPSKFLAENPYSFQGFSAPFYDSDDVLGFTGGSVLLGNTVAASSHVNSMAYHTLFINSSLGTHNDSLGPIGQSTICRKVIIDQPQGNMINDYHSQAFDYIKLEKQSISSMRFRVTDWRGNPVEMEHWSFSIIFVPEQEFLKYLLINGRNNCRNSCNNCRNTRCGESCSSRARGAYAIRTFRCSRGRWSR
jgi:hypothetical protein